MEKRRRVESLAGPKGREEKKRDFLLFSENIFVKEII
jgi:hypothetical protein